ncbi:MAG: LPS export ABC transporter periplasmic protein LptC [SAR324 cluster bacterium]|nr:LPS export ABC transporter periplasmic protein LptC [SAR324 cluster bacterium]
MKRLLFFIAFMAMGTGLLIWLLGTEPVPESATPETPREPGAMMHMTEVAIRQMEGNWLRWELWARSANLLDDANTVQFRSVRFKLYGNKPGDPVFMGSSKAARLVGKPPRVILQGDVVLKRGTLLEIRTENLVFDQKKNLVRAPGKVFLKTPRTIHSGDSLIYFLAEDSLTLTRPFFAQ